MSTAASVATAPTPMLFVELKKPEPMKAGSDWVGAMSAYIESAYQDDPSKFRPAMDALSRQRADIADVSKDASGRDQLYRYYGQLELLDLRFVFDEEHCAVNFAWFDSFKPSAAATSQVSLAFEKAGVIFNLASLLSHMAASANRADAAGMKLAFNYFQCAAGVFQFISDNFLHAPSADLSKDCIQILSQLMLAQAQECMVEKVAAEKKKSLMLSKLASQAAHMYSQVLESIATVSVGDLKGYFPLAWVLYLKVKYNYMSSLANYYKAQQCESDSLFGEQVAYLTAAEATAKESAKFCKDLVGVKAIHLMGGSTAATSKTELGPATTLHEMVKSFHASVADKLRTATKDNDVVYHAAVPAPTSLGPLEKLNTTKPMKLLDLHPEISATVGPDPFKDLISLQVHEKASLYSSKKDELIRGESVKVAEAEADADASIRSLGLPGLLDKFKTTMRSRGAVISVDVPSEVFEWARFISEQERQEPVGSLLAKLDNMRSGVTQVLTEAERLLDEERIEYDAMKSKHGTLWTQSTSATAAGQLRGDIQQQRDQLAQGDRGDRALKEKWTAYGKDIGLLSEAGFAGSKSRVLEQAYVDAMAGLNPTDTGAVGNLLDMPVDNSERGEQEMIETVDGLLRSIAKVKKDRQAALAELKQQVKDDDIHNLLVLNKKNEEAVLKVELDKFMPLRQKIIELNQIQVSLLDQLATGTMKLSSTQVAKQTDTLYAARLALTTKFKDARTAFDEVCSNAKRGVAYYTKLNEMAQELCQRCRQFTDARSKERTDLLRTLSQGHQQLLTEKLARLSTASATPAVPSSYSPQTPSYSPNPQSNYSSNSGHPGAGGHQYAPPAAGYGTAPVPNYNYGSAQPPQHYGQQQQQQAPSYSQPAYSSAMPVPGHAQAPGYYALPPGMQAPLQSVGNIPSTGQYYQQPQQQPPMYQPSHQSMNGAYYSGQQQPHGGAPYTSAPPANYAYGTAPYQPQPGSQYPAAQLPPQQSQLHKQNSLLD